MLNQKPEIIKRSDTGYNVAPDEAIALSEFTTEQQQKIIERAKILSVLANVVGKDSSMRVRIGKAGGGWYWEPENESYGTRVTMDAKDLLEKPLGYCRMVVCHEGFHRWLSKFSQIKEGDLKLHGFHALWNGLEDPRINNAGVDAYPYLKEDLQILYESILLEAAKNEKQALDTVGIVPKAMGAVMRLIGEWYKERTGFEGELLKSWSAKEVTKFIEEVLEDSSIVWNTYPSSEELSKLTHQDQEKLIETYCKVSWQKIIDDIWPKYKILVELDKRDAKAKKAFDEWMNSEKSDEETSPNPVNQKISDDTRKQLEDIKNQIGDNTPEEEHSNAKQFEDLSDQAKEDLANALEELSKEQSKEGSENSEDNSICQQIEQQLEDLLNDFAKSFEKKSVDDSDDDKAETKNLSDAKTTDSAPEETPINLEALANSAKEKLEEIFDKNQTPYKKYLEELAPVIRDTENVLKKIFKARKESHEITGLKSGPIFDVTRRIQEKAQNIKAIDSRSFKRRTLPLENDYAITLLIDMSGSMSSGGKVQEALKALIVLSEVLTTLGIKYEIIGFHDQLKIYKPFSTNLDSSIRENCITVLGEVNTEHAAYNDDGWAIEESFNRLVKQKAQEKHLIVISDGIPVPSPAHSGSRFELGSIIRQITAKNQVNLIGLGLGCGTEHVSSYYPNSIANISVSDLPLVISDLVKNIVKAIDK